MKKNRCLKKIWIQFCYDHPCVFRECCRIRCSAEKLCIWLEKTDSEKTGNKRK